ncbi:MAG TPA: gamma carbonic anhydrase family protein [Aeromicrobium sp.]|nr:gamma carbonic anhydrase family protein [Aeromicrobium sp.]
MIIALGDVEPDVDEEAWVAPTATLIGAVELAAGSSIWYGAVLRGDNEPIRIGENSNIQDNVVIHTDMGAPVVVGAGVSVGHSAVIHGARIGDDVLIGMGSIVMNRAVVGAGSLVAAGALIPEDMVVPPRSLVVGVPARVVRELGDDDVERNRANATTYTHHRDRHREATTGA